MEIDHDSYDAESVRLFKEQLLPEASIILREAARRGWLTEQECEELLDVSSPDDVEALEQKFLELGAQ